MAKWAPPICSPASSARRAPTSSSSPRDFDAGEGERIGLLSRVVPDGTVVDVALDVAAAMAERGRAALVRAKHLLRANLDTPDLATALAPTH